MAGAQDGVREEEWAPCWLCNTIGPAAVPAASSSSSSAPPLAAQVLGVSGWGLASCRPGISAYTRAARAGERYF